MLDDYVKKMIDNNNMLVPWFLITSYLYYEHNLNIISDALYDDIAKQLQLYWPFIDHIHKNLIDYDALEAGTGYYLAYPPLVRGSAISLANEHLGTNLIY
jgi:hypothetical protein